ncbi:Hypothetical_protein [Hexamita inflata]|uniref:Hypothetical_protein n=1 Tax=Hexamita inflata TaxID=28002 RepID=A0AA86URS1_9EUKA|nr:Hypothetical protein HINF_LOCUS49711 [Hexamita inflata]
MNWIVCQHLRQVGIRAQASSCVQRRRLVRRFAGKYKFFIQLYQTFVYTGSVSCSKPLRVSKVCSFIQKKRLQKNESMLDSPVPLLGFALQLFLGCSYWAGRFFSLCFKMSSMFSILFRDLIFYQNIPQ